MPFFYYCLNSFPFIFSPSKNEPIPSLKKQNINEQIHPGWFRDESSHEFGFATVLEEKKGTRGPVRTYTVSTYVKFTAPVYTLILRGATNQHATSASTSSY